MSDTSGPLAGVMAGIDADTSCVGCGCPAVAHTPCCGACGLCGNRVCPEFDRPARQGDPRPAFRVEGVAGDWVAFVDGKVADRYQYRADAVCHVYGRLVHADAGARESDVPVYPNPDAGVASGITYRRS